MPLHILFGQYNKIYRFFLHMTASKEFAEDLTQETFYQALLSLPKFKGKSKLSTWLYGIARNVYLKSEVKNKTQFLSANMQDSIKAPSEYEPEETFMRTEKWRNIVDILNELPEDYKTVIVLREVEDMGFEDIAKIMNKSPDAARVTLYRAKKAFRRIYEKRGEENE